MRRGSESRLIGFECLPGYVVRIAFDDGRKVDVSVSGIDWFGINGKTVFDVAPSLWPTAKLNKSMNRIEWTESLYIDAWCAETYGVPVIEKGAEV